MPIYQTTSDLTRTLRDIDARLLRLENRATTGAAQGAANEGSIIGSGDYLLRTGDTMTGALTLNSSLTATSATFSGNVTIQGTLTVSGGGSFAQDSLVVHLAGAENITGTKSFKAEQRFDGGGTYADPDTGVTRAIKVGANGIAVNGGIKTDTLSASGAVTLTGTLTAAGGTFSSAIVANGGVQYGSSSFLDLSPVATTAASSGTGVGDKVSLHTNYGFGVQSNRLVAYMSSAASFAVRAVSGTGNKSSGATDAVRLGADGTVTATGLISGSAGLTISGGTVSLPAGSLSASSLGVNTITGTGTGSQAAGIGHLAAGTVGNYNIADQAITTQKLSAALIVANSQISGVDAGKFLPGTITADGIFLGAGGHIYAGPTALPVTGNQARVDLNSGGIQAYDGSAQTFNLAANGSLTLKGSITAGSTITGTTVTGTSGLTAGSGNNVFIAGSSGIQLGHATFASAPFRVDMTGALTATSATISGTITGSTVTATNLDATNTVSGAALVANTVTVDKVSVGLQSSDDLMLNGSFADGAVGWSEFRSTGSLLGSGSTTVQAASGTTSYFLNLATNGGRGIANPALPVSAGEQYAIGWKLRAETLPGPFYLHVYFGYTQAFTFGTLATETPATPTLDLFPAGATSSASAGTAAVLHNYTLPATDTWYEFRGSFTVPINARWMRVVPMAWSNATGAWTAYVDDVWLRRQATGTEIAGGVLRTQHFTANTISGTIIQTNTLAADRIATGTLSAQTAITAGTPGGARVEIDGRTSFVGIRLYNASNLNRFNADGTTGALSLTGEINATSGTFSGSITASGDITGGTYTGAVFRSSSTPTASTGGFILDHTGLTLRMPDSANIINNAAISGIEASGAESNFTTTIPNTTLQAVQGFAFEGLWALMVRVANSTSIPANSYIETAATFAVTGGQTYSGSVYYRPYVLAAGAYAVANTGTSGQQLQILFYDSSNALVGTGTGTQKLSSKRRNNYYRLEANGCLAPATATSARLRWVQKGATTTSATTWAEPHWMFDAWQLENQPTSTPYMEGTRTDTSNNISTELAIAGEGSWAKLQSGTEIRNGVIIDSTINETSSIERAAAQTAAALGVTAGTNWTLTQFDAFVTLGRIVTINMRATHSSTPSAGTPIASGLPWSVGTNRHKFIVGVGTASATASAGLAAHVEVYQDDILYRSMASGTWSASNYIHATITYTLLP